MCHVYISHTECMHLGMYEANPPWISARAARWLSRVAASSNCALARSCVSSSSFCNSSKHPSDFYFSSISTLSLAYRYFLQRVNNSSRFITQVVTFTEVTDFTLRARSRHITSQSVKAYRRSPCGCGVSRLHA